MLEKWYLFVLMDAVQYFSGENHVENSFRIQVALEESPQLC